MLLTLHKQCYDRSMKRAYGFTVIELLVVLVVVALLATVGAVAYRATQQSARDNHRQSSAIVIADELEAYYDRHGEYPACTSLQQPLATIETTFPVLKKRVVVAPHAADQSSSSVLCADLTESPMDSYAYVGDGSSSCTTSTPCQGFKLRWREEGSGEIQEITSRRSPIAATPIGPPPGPNPELPGTPYSLNDIRHICASPSNAPAGYTVVTTPSLATLAQALAIKSYTENLGQVA